MNEQDDRLSGVLAILTVLALSVFIIWVILSLLVWKGKLKMNSINDFKKGDKIIYIPMHADGNTKHKDCEHGFVTRQHDGIKSSIKEVLLEIENLP